MCLLRFESALGGPLNLIKLVKWRLLLEGFSSLFHFILYFLTKSSFCSLTDLVVTLTTDFCNEFSTAALSSQNRHLSMLTCLWSLGWICKISLHSEEHHVLSQAWLFAYEKMNHWKKSLTLSTYDTKQLYL